MKKDYIFILLLAVFFCAVYAFAFDSKLDLNGDNANYLRYAQNIVKGDGYSTTTVNGLVAASQYPPAYSTFLAFFMFFGIHSLVFFKILNGILFFTSLALLFYMLRKLTDNVSLAFAATLLPVFSPQLQHFSNIVMSEMLFLFFSVFCFFAFYQYRQKSKPCFWKSPWFYVIILSATGAYYTRTVGMALILSVIVFFLFRKEWKQAVFSFLGIVLLNIPWSIRNAAHDIESRYFGTIMTVNPWRPESGTISTFGELVEKMIDNFDETVIKGFKEILFPFLQIDYGVPSGFWAVIGGILIVAVVFYGVWNLKTLRWAMIAYLVGQIGLFMLWHGGNGTRYVVPVAPFIFVGFYVGVYYLLSTVFKKWIIKKENNFTNHLAYAFLFLLFAMWTPLKTQAENAKFPYPQAYNNYFAIAKEMQKQLPEGKICCCRKPELFNYYAPSIIATNYKYATDTEELIRDLIEKRVDFVILEQLGYGSTSRYLYPAIQQYPELFPVLWHLQNPDTYLLKFEREKAEAEFLREEKEG